MTGRLFRVTLMAAVAVVAGCDAVQPADSGSLVVEAFMSPGSRPSTIRLRTTSPLEASASSAYGSVARDASVTLRINDEDLSYEETGAGLYDPPVEYDRILETGDTFRLQVLWEGISATASGVIPAPIRLDSILVSVPESPVEAVLIDSLRRDTLGVDATTGYIFPIEATIWWGSEGEADSWIQTRLSPRTEFTSVVVDFFLLPEGVFREEDAVEPGVPSGVWTGLYAVPVEDSGAVLPTHDLSVSLVRAGEAYAAFARNRSDGEGREPPSNVQGALGIAVGLSVDSLTVRVDATNVGRKAVVFER